MSSRYLGILSMLITRRLDWVIRGWKDYEDSEEAEKTGNISDISPEDV